MKNWRDLSYLLEGDPRQQHVYEAIMNSRIMKILAAFDPVLTGTYPIGIYVKGSDIDIVCEYTNPEHLTTVLNIAFSTKMNFKIKTKNIRGIETIIARFDHAGFKFEIFGQPTAVEDQYAYRHMLIEDQLLSANGALFRKEIIALKEKGLSTEEAFAFSLGIEGDPYEGLLNYSIEI